MEYNGIELKEITTSQIFDPPKEMLVWDYVDSAPFKMPVHAIVASKTFPVIAEEGDYQYCAEIPEEPKSRRATNRELSKWLAQGHGEYRNQIGAVSNLYIYVDLETDVAVPSYIRARKWDDIDWHEPTVDYMGIEQ